MSKYKDSKEACRVEIRGSKTQRKDKKQRNEERTREKSHKERRKKDRKVQGANRTMNARKKVRLGIREGKKEETRQQEAVQLPDSRLLFCWPVLAVSVTSAFAICTNSRLWQNTVIVTEVFVTNLIIKPPRPPLPSPAPHLEQVED